MLRRNFILKSNDYGYSSSSCLPPKTKNKSKSFTNPIPGVTFKPMIQLQGYCPEPLASLSFDVSNAAGLFTNEQGWFLDVSSG